MWATLDKPGPGLKAGAAAANRCGLPGEQASVRWMAGPDTRVGGPDTLLAQRLAAGDDHALAEIFDWRLAVAIVAFLGVLFGHAHLFGVSPFPGGWVPSF